MPDYALDANTRALAQVMGAAVGIADRRAISAQRAAGITPMDFGGVGDGIANDTAALASALMSGEPISLGGPGVVYRVTQPIAVSGVPVNWRSSGARILFDLPEAIYRGVYVDQLPSGDHSILGLLIDGGDRTQQGLRINAATGASGSIVIEDTHVANLRRASTQFSEGGSGIHLNVCHDQVTIDRCSVKHLRLSAGAGLSGTAGVQGIMVRPGGGGRPRLITARNNLLEDIRCDDLGYNADQDGMLFYVDRSSAPTQQRETHVECSGNVFTNCLGRAIKGQAESMNVTGTRVVRTEGHTVAEAGVDIDLQVGGGKVTGLSAIYDGVNSAPFRAIILSTTDEISKPVAVGHVDGVEIAMSNGATMESVIQTSQRVGKPASYRASNITVEGGTLETVVRLAGGNMGSEVYLDLDRVSAAPTLSFVKATNGPATGLVNVDRLVNTGPTEVLPFARNSTVMNVRVSVGGNCWRLLDTKYPGMITVGTGLTGFGEITRVNSLAAKDDTVGGGRSRYTTFQLAAGETREFPDSFRSVNNAGMLIVSVAKGRADQGIFRCDNAAVEVMAAGASFTVGTTTEPASGVFRLWAGANGRPMISNRDSSTRVFTCQMFG